MVMCQSRLCSHPNLVRRIIKLTRHNFCVLVMLHSLLGMPFLFRLKRWLEMFDTWPISAVCTSYHHISHHIIFHSSHSVAILAQSPNLSPPPRVMAPAVSLLAFIYINIKMYFIYMLVLQIAAQGFYPLRRIRSRGMCIYIICI